MKKKIDKAELAGVIVGRLIGFVGIIAIIYYTVSYLAS